MANPLDIPVVFLVKIGDSDLIEVASGQIPWPYDARKALEATLRDAADALAADRQRG